MSTPREQLALLLAQMQQPQEQIAYPEMQALPGPAEIPADDARPLRRMQALGLLGSMAGGRVGQFAGSMQQAGADTETRMLNEALKRREALAQQVNAENQYGQQRANFETGRQDAGGVNLARQAGLLGQMATIDSQQATLAQQNRDEYAATKDAAGNPILYNKRTGEIVQGGVGGAGAGGAGAAIGAPKLTDAQAKAFDMAERGQRLVPQIKEMLGTINPTGIGANWAATMGPGLFSRAKSALVPGEEKQYWTAARDVLAAMLRKESGAAITKDEWDKFAPLWLPWPGDSEEERQQKIDMLEARIQSATIQAGPGGQRVLQQMEAQRGATGETADDAIELEVDY